MNTFDRLIGVVLAVVVLVVALVVVDTRHRTIVLERRLEVTAKTVAAPPDAPPMSRVVDPVDDPGRPFHPAGWWKAESRPAGSCWEWEELWVLFTVEGVDQGQAVLVKSGKVDAGPGALWWLWNDATQTLEFQDREPGLRPADAGKAALVSWTPRLGGSVAVLSAVFPGKKTMDLRLTGESPPDEVVLAAARSRTSIQLRPPVAEAVELKLDKKIAPSPK